MSFTLPVNFSYDDPLPFTCKEDPDVAYSIFIYIFQASYLVLGATLNSLIIHTIFKSKNKEKYRSNSFYYLYTSEAIMSIYDSLVAAFFSRLVLRVSPLCTILSPFFFTPSIITKAYYATYNYNLAFKTISQIVISFNRMTCVVLPIRHATLWKRILKPILIIQHLFPLGVIWNILLSRVYTNPSGYGFSVNYKAAIPWANVSLLNLFHCIPCVVLVTIFFIVTIYGLTMLEYRIKNVERHLTIFTLIMGLQTTLFAFTQIYFAFLATYIPSIRGYILLLAFHIFDILHVYSPIALLISNRELRNDIFRLKKENGGYAAGNNEILFSKK
ncbi:Serpentine receptor class gamma [Caenorhabditis elegans]|uniref:Serpentine receptor class gamma n=1 Tax=Caenorhabditis elegans TaxID=6239 RepID=Q9TYL7_CAEEL|nr:Serpentine receptor class gamma [Caenorhabditis elegans]CCD61989.1 Serpentine receptor class gamma [Caenorhabditis elegans]|eukprot:NP_494443.2 Serpentine receptor class gamma [Caenorhabditis elegans]